EQRTLGITERESCGGLWLAVVLEHLLPEPVGPLSARFVVAGPRLDGDREAGRHLDPEVGHLGELTPLAAEEVAHQGGAFRLPRAEEVDVFRHELRSPSCTATKSFNTTGWIV